MSTTSLNGSKARLMATMKKCWNYQGRNYLFNSWEEVDGAILISTDTDTISIEYELVPMFLNGLIEVNPETGVSKAEDNNQIILHTFSKDNQSLIIDGLLGVFNELVNAKSPEKIKTLGLKANNLVKITTALTGVSKLELEVKKSKKRG